MAVNVSKLNNPLLYNYQYDQLNRLVAMDAWKKTGSAWSNITKLPDFQERVSYDANGNILGYKRNGNNTFAGKPLGMDSLTYSYVMGTNRLDHVNDTVPAGNYSEDIDNQSAGNYVYDSIGNLIKDNAEGITSISWTVYGKISRIVKGDSVIISYTYDASGNRISKTVIKSATSDTAITWYVRDAQGNVLSVYSAGNDSLNDGHLSQTEQHLYGSSRLGILRSSTDVADSDLSVSNDTTMPLLDKGYTFTFARGNKLFELSNHLGNVLVTLNDTKIGVSLNDSTVDYFNPQVVSAQDYYPFGMLQVGRSYNAGGYRFGFNGKEKNDEVKGEGNQLDFGARIYDPRLGRWSSVDPEASQYPGYAPYAYVLNTPLSAVDPDGKLVIFIGGLRFWVKSQDQQNHRGGGSSIHSSIYNYDIYRYWSVDKNSFGRKADIAGGFMNRLNDKNAWFTSGSSSFQSQPDKRIEQGKQKAQKFHAMVQSGAITLAKDETIKIVSHSQGGAFSAGFAQQLMTYKDANGKPLYNIEVMYYITPHQPDKFSHVSGIKGVQYSHPKDAVSSDDPWWLTNGASKFKKIKGITEFDGRDIMGGQGQPEAEGPNGNRSGHNVTDNDFIFDIKPGQPGYIAPRKDNSVNTDSQKKSSDPKSTRYLQL